MKLTVLGSGSFLPVASRNNAGYLLDIDDHTLLLDCGSGTLRQLAKVSRSFLEIDAVFLSHAHIDHTADLIPLLFTRKYAPSFQDETDKWKHLNIYGHPDCLDLQKQRVHIHKKWIEDKTKPYTFTEITECEQLNFGYQLGCARANHTSGSLIYRFTDMDGKSIVYSGDTGYCSSLVEITKGCDLLVMECSFRDEQGKETHMTPGDVGRVLESADVKRCLITHIYPDNDDRTLRDRIPHPQMTEILIAEDLQTIHV